MNVIHSTGHVWVTLSRRNLQQLLDALDKGYAPTIGIVRQCEDGTVLHVAGETDETHYAAREAGPGLDRLLQDK
jgi:hypothetical protein